LHHPAYFQGPRRLPRAQNIALSIHCHHRYTSSPHFNSTSRPPAFTVLRLLAHPQLHCIHQTPTSSRSMSDPQFPQSPMSRLPPELLLRIGAYFTHNRNLCAMALVSRAWRVVAQEWLLRTPRFNLTYLDRYLWELGHHVHLHAQIRTVEIVSSSKGRVRRRTRVLFPRPEYLATSAPENWNGEFLRRCSEIIRYYAADRVGLNEWTTALGSDCVPALFGVLVCILPNLRALKLGNAWMMDFPIFGCVLAPDVNNNNSWLPRHWKHSFLDVVRDQLLSRLEILEVPVDLKTWMIPGDVNTIFDFRKFVNLRVLDASLGVL
jgi:hypothetical protein